VRERERRVGLNEALFRRINERLEGVNEALGWVAGRLHVVCECGDEGCVERITLTPTQYERLRADPTTFAVVRGHDDPPVESVVEEHGEWSVVRKHPGPPAELAEQTDERA
jgi:hypothetical protein